MNEPTEPPFRYFGGPLDGAEVEDVSIAFAPHYIEDATWGTARYVINEHEHRYDWSAGTAPPE